MASIEEIREIRLRKLEALKKKGIEAYPIDSNLTCNLLEASDDFDSLLKKKEVTLGGRVMSLRPQGGLIFLNIEDGFGRFQAMLKKSEDIKISYTRKDHLDGFLLFADTVDIGDFVELSGKLFITKRKEKTIEVSSWRMLSKSLRPLPEKWHGLQDVEERFRKRYLDSLMSPEVKERFILRSRIISFIRNFLEKESFVEVETPILQSLHGGATALPFKTHHNALDIDLFLRIAPELYLKRMLVGGFPKVFEIGRNFRNEGIDITHNPEFTMLEFYESYSDSIKQMAFVEKMIKALAKKAIGSMNLEYGGEKVDFKPKFLRVSYFDLFKRYALLSHPETASVEELKLKASQLGADMKKEDGRDKILDAIYKKVCRPKLIQPTFITDYPASYLPLAKRDSKDKEKVDAFQLIIGGREIVKAFSELNDPIDQRDRFEEQEKEIAKGDKEAQSRDDDFLEALEYGMPPAGGVGIGIDRLVMLFTNTQNIREVIYFPTLRPKNRDKE